MSVTRISRQRVITTAAATTALPAVAIGSLALAVPAAAAPAQPLQPKQPTASNISQAKATILRSTSKGVPASVKVKSGDTISSIAHRYRLSVSTVLKLNKLNSKSVIYPGQRIKLRGAAPSQATTKTATSTASRYTVKAGDTLSGIATKHRISLATLTRLNGLKSSSIIYPGQKLRIRGSAAASSAPTAKASTAGKAATYTVKSGDTLSGIAAKTGVSLSMLTRNNGLKNSSTIYPGQKLKLRPSGSVASTPAKSAAKPSASASYTVKSGDTLSGIAAKTGTSLSTLLRLNGLKASSVIFPGQKIRTSGNASTSTRPAAKSTGSTKSSGTYTVKSGDTLSGIAARHGMSLSALLSANGLKASSTIYAGQTIRLGGSATSTSTSTSTSNVSAAATQKIPANFLHYVYPEQTVAAANKNYQTLLSMQTPSKAYMRALIVDTARSMGVDPKLALGHAITESHLNHASVSPANAIGVMQVIPSSGEWASTMVGRKLNLLDPKDNVVAGVAIIRHLQRHARSVDEGIAGYYQGLHGVQTNGMYPDTRDYVRKVRANMR